MARELRHRILVPFAADLALFTGRGTHAQCSYSAGTGNEFVLPFRKEAGAESDCFQAGAATDETKAPEEAWHCL